MLLLRFFSLVLVLIEKKYRTPKTVFDHISNHPEFPQNYSAVRRIFNSLLDVWKYTSRILLIVISRILFEH